MRLIGYVRVSRVAGREGASFISPDVQTERIKAQALAQGHTVVSWETDLDQPGSRYERPAFQAALSAVERGEADGIAVYALDRFARSVPDAALALKRLDEAGGVLISVRDALDTSTPVGRFARTMMLAIAELELERIRENWRTATEHAIERGVHITRVPPFGYLRGEDGRLEPDPETAPTLREVFLRRATGSSWQEIASYLDGVATRPGGGAWPISSVCALVPRRTYLGEAAAGDLRNKEAHPPLVSRAEWEAAQSGTRRLPTRVSGGLLLGIARCAECGGAMTSATAGRRGYRNYHCRVRSAQGICAVPAKVSQPKLDGYVESLFLEWLSSHPVRLRGAPSDGDTTSALTAVETAEAELIAYRDADLVSIVGVDIYRDGLRGRAVTLDEARARYADALRERPAIGVFDLGREWPALGTSERNLVLREAIETVSVARGERREGGGFPAIESRVRILWRPEVSGVATT